MAPRPRVPCSSLGRGAKVHRLSATTDFPADSRFRLPPPMRPFRPAFACSGVHALYRSPYWLSCICSALPGPLFWFPAVRGAVASPPAPASLSLARRQAIHRRRQSPGSRQRHTGLLLLHSNRRQKPRRRPRFPPPSSLPSSALLRPPPAPLRVIATISIRLPTTSIPDVPSSRHGARCC